MEKKGNILYNECRLNILRRVRLSTLEEGFKNIDTDDSIAREQVFKQYEMFVSSADKVSSNRMDVNKFFMSINSGILTIYSMFFEKITSALWIVPILGIIISLAWIRSLKSYSMLNSAKFKIINKVEEQLPLQPYKDEWDILKCNCEYKTLSKTEQQIPYAFGIVYIVLLIIQLHSLFIK